MATASSVLLPKHYVPSTPYERMGTALESIAQVFKMMSAPIHITRMALSWLQYTPSFSSISRTTMDRLQYLSGPCSIGSLVVDLIICKEFLETGWIDGKHPEVEKVHLATAVLKKVCKIAKWLERTHAVTLSSSSSWAFKVVGNGAILAGTCIRLAETAWFHPEQKLRLLEIVAKLVTTTLTIYLLFNVAPLLDFSKLVLQTSTIFLNVFALS